MRFPLSVVAAVRESWPARKPLFCRLSTVDGVGMGWSLADSVAFGRELRRLGVDVLDCSSGGMPLPSRELLVPRQPGFQVPFAERLRREVGMQTMAVGLITAAAQAEAIVTEGHADLVAIGREMLRNPNWPLHAAAELEAKSHWARWPRPFGWWLARRETTRGR